MKRFVIDRQLVKANFRAAARCAAGAEIIADLSGDVYGLGLSETARLLVDEGVRSFAVSEAADAKLLRERGFTEERLMMLRSTTDRTELEELVELNVVCTVGSTDSAIALNSIAEERRTVIEVQIAVNVGGGGYGFPSSEREAIYGVYKNMNNLAVTGVFTVLSRDGVRKKSALRQLAEFRETIAQLHSRGYETGILHAVSGIGLFLHGSAGFDAVRIGGMTLAGSLGRRAKQLNPVGTIEADIEELCWYKRGDCIDGRTLKKPVHLAVISVGRVNGCSDGNSKKYLGIFRRRRVKINGVKTAVYGRVQLMHTFIDVSHISCSVGDTVSLPADPVTVKGLVREYR